MPSHLQEKFEAELEHYLDMQFTNRSGGKMCIREQSDPLPYLSELLWWACRAAEAREWFGRHGPAHLQPLPLVYYDEQETILCSSDMDRHLVVHYSNSLRHRKFDYLEHPLFFDYARGVVALPDKAHLAAGLSVDELRWEFPPKPLLGLGNDLRWRPPPPRVAVRA